MELMRFHLTGGGSVVVEMDEEEVGVSRAGRAEEAIATAAASFETAMAGVRGAATAALEQFRSLRPGEVELEFGVRLNAQAGAVLAKSGAGAHLKVKLRWPQPPDATA